MDQTVETLLITKKWMVLPSCLMATLMVLLNIETFLSNQSLLSGSRLTLQGKDLSCLEEFFLKRNRIKKYNHETFRYICVQ